MQAEPTAIAPNVNVLVVDQSCLFRERLQSMLRAQGFRRIEAEGVPATAAQLVAAARIDLAIIALDEFYANVWDALAAIPGRPFLVVGVQRECPDSRREADAVLSRTLCAQHLGPTLKALYASIAVRRCRLVPFPTPGPHRLVVTRR